MTSHDDLMRRTLDLAQENVKNGGRPFASLIVKDGEVVVEAVNTVHLTKDPSDHSEMRAIRLASGILQREDLSGCEIYALSIPCPMCLSCIILSKIKTIHYAVEFDQRKIAVNRFKNAQEFYEVVANYGRPFVEYHYMPEYAETGASLLSNWTAKRIT